MALTDKLVAYQDKLYEVAVINDAFCDKYPFLINDSPVSKHAILSLEKNIILWRGGGDFRMLFRISLS